MKNTLALYVLLEAVDKETAMTTVRATFENQEEAHKALLALRGYGAEEQNIKVEAENRNVPSETTVIGVMTGAAAGSVAGAAITGAAAVALPVAIPVVAALSLSGAAMGGLGGSVAGAILGGGEGAKEEQENEAVSESKPHPERTVVSVTAPEDQVPALEAALAQLGGRLQHGAA